MPFKYIAEQLKEIRKLTKVVWCITLGLQDEEWSIIESSGLSKKYRKEVNNFLANDANGSWLGSVSKNAKNRWKKSGDLEIKLGCKRIFAFPTKSANSLILVGSDALDKIGKGFFKILGMQMEEPDLLDLNLLEQRIGTSKHNNNENISFDPSESFRYLIESTRSFLPAHDGLIAIRFGDEFKIEYSTNQQFDMLGKGFTTENSQVLSRIVESQIGSIVNNEELGKIVPFDVLPNKNSDGLLVPLIIGNRVIGLLIFISQSFSEDDLQRAMVMAKHVARPVEKTIIFNEASLHLQNVALLNELSSVVSVGLDIDEVSVRIQKMLQNAFAKGQAELLLLSSDGESLVEVGFDESVSSKKEYPIATTFVGQCVEDQLPKHSGDVTKLDRYMPFDGETRSKLVAPLMLRKKVLGVLSLESSKIDAFNRQDENFLLVVAGQIAVFMENARLNEQTAQRADRLSVINELVQQVVGLTDQEDISMRAASLMEHNSGFEMVVVSLLDESKHELVAKGVAGTNLPDLPQGMRYAKDFGISGRVLATGVSELILDVTQDDEYFSFPGWEPGSGICVPLREGDEIFGVINVESQKQNAFSENDLLTSEALAGVLSSVLMYAQRYDELQANIAQLETVRETSLDLSTDLDLDVLLKRVVNRVKELVNARGAEIGLVNEDESLVKVIVSENPWQDYTGYTFPLMSGVAGRVAAIGEPLLVSDYNAWSGKGKDDFKAPFTTVAGVPLILSDETIGTLTVQDDRPDRSFSKSDIKVLELVAPQITVFIRNARLYQELGERMESQLLAEKRLIRSARLAAVGEMAAGVAHELNNPLTTVTGFTELILEEVPEDFPHREDLEMVLNEARRARGVVRRLLDFSHQGDFLRANADVNEVMSDVLALVHHVAQTTGINIRVELWDDLPELRVDRNQMQQVFLNLIHNALQAMPDGGDLIVRSSLEEKDDADWVMIAIQDTGHGIATDELPHIFEPFYTTKPTGSGTGLGLSISYGIVADHGGMMDVQSEFEQGSTFIIWLPIEIEKEEING